MKKRILIKNILYKLFCQYKYYKNYIIPNLYNIVTVTGRPVGIDQKVLLRGNGIIKFGNDCFLGTEIGGRSYGHIELQVKSSNAIITFGNQVCSNNNLFISCINKVSIGSDTVIGERVTIFDFEGHGLRPNERKKIGQIGFVLIGENVWIGNNVTILKNTTIGNNTIIAAGAIVSGKFPENVIIGGIPAKIIKSLPN